MGACDEMDLCDEGPVEGPVEAAIFEIIIAGGDLDYTTSTELASAIASLVVAAREIGANACVSEYYDAVRREGCPVLSIVDVWIDRHDGEKPKLVARRFYVESGTIARLLRQLDAVESESVDDTREGRRVRREVF